MKKIFTFAVVVMFAATAFASKCLKVTCSEAKTNFYDSQVIIQLPKALESGKTYTITMDVKGSVAVSTEGNVKLGGVVEDNTSSNKDQYGNSADLQYVNNWALTTEWANVTVANTNGNYPYDRLILNIGALCGDLYVDNIVVKEDGSSTEYEKIDFEDGISAVSKRSWHNHVTIAEYDTANEGVTDWALKVTCTEAKSNFYDSQVIIQLPKALESSKTYTITMDVKGSVAVSTEGNVKLGGVVEDNTSSNKDQYGNSADLQYVNNWALTTEWANVTVANTNGNYPYDRLILNIGALCGDLYVDNIVVKEDGTSTEYEKLDFNDGITAVSTRSWHNHVSITSAPANHSTTALNAMNAEKTKCDGAKKVMKNGRIVITRGEKTYNTIGQEY